MNKFWFINSFYGRGQSHTQEYRAFLDKLKTDGVTLPSSQVQSLQNQVVRTLVDSGVWGKLDIVRLFATNYLDTQAASLYNLKKPEQNIATAHGGMTYGYAGWKGDGTDGYINQNWNPSAAGGNYSQNSAYEGVYVMTEASGGAVMLTGHASSAISVMRNSNALSQRINSSGNLSAAIDLSGIGYKALSRGAATEFDTYSRETKIVANSNSTTMPNENRLMFRWNTSYGDSEVAAYVAGGYLTEEEHIIVRDAINNYLTGIFATNYSDTKPIDVYIIIGQSNAAGRGFNTQIAPELNGKVGAQILTLEPTPPGIIDPSESSFQELELGVNNTFEQPDSYHGIEMRLGYEMQSLAGAGKDVYILKMGVGATSMDSRWKATGGTFATAFMKNTLIYNGLAKLRSDIRRPFTIRGVIFIQGESDCLDGLGANYQDHYLGMIKEFLDQLNVLGYKTDKVRWFDWLVKNDGEAGYTTQDFDDVIAAKQYVMDNFLIDYPDYADRIKAFTYADPAEVPFNSGDHQHYSAAGIETMAQATVEYFSQYRSE